MRREETAERSFLQRTVLPVLDLMGGQVVRGVGGRRTEYRPIESLLTASSEPLAVAKALRDRFGFERFYVADLDAITNGQVHWDVLRSLAGEGFELVVDAGVTSVAHVRRLLDAGANRVILALESFDSPDPLHDVLAATSPQSIEFSLDLKAGRPIADPSRWPLDPLRLADLVCDAGIDHLIILDLAAVGVRGGLVTGELCRQVRARHPKITIVTGGGIRSAAEIKSAVDCGADLVLVATALHDGSLDLRVCDAS
jgi:phosphoribosylformimino-5-aminoimidazole carboxamide ribotide isomerase